MENTLSSICSFFKLGAPFGEHPFYFQDQDERIRFSALLERCPNSILPGKQKIRTLLPQEKGSDFSDLVEISGIEPLTS